MLSCQELSEKASDYLDGEVPLRTRVEMHLHMFFCQNCRRFLRQLRLAIDALALSAGSDDDDGAGEERILNLLAPSPTSDGADGDPVKPEVVIYTTSWCPYCQRAKALLDRKRVRYLEIDVAADPARRRDMIAWAGGRRSVPQIFIRGQAIGGSDELYALESSGELDRLLGRR